MADSPPTGRQIRLSNGRRLGYAEYGDAAGEPLFFFHGFPGSRLEAAGLGETAARVGFRLLSLDLPGIGLSDFQTGRAAADWPADVAALADALGLARFAVLGGSGGAKYAAACAALLPARLTAVGLYSCAAPLEEFVAAGASSGARLGWRVARLALGLPWLTLLVARAQLAALRRAPRFYLSVADSRLALADRAPLGGLRAEETRLENLREAYRSGYRGVAWEMLLIARPWGFRLEGIPLRVNLWHGEADLVTPPAMGRYLAQRIPDCVARFYAGEGHFSLLINHTEEIMSALRS